MSPEEFRIELVSAVKDGPGPLVYHVRDQELLVSRLPLHQVASTDEFTEFAVEMNRFAGTIQLPDAPAVTPMGTPDTSMQGWIWPDGSNMLLMPIAFDGLPALEGIGTETTASQLLITNRPMALVLQGDNPHARCAATINGYVSDRVQMGINIQAPNASSRERLIAAASTLNGHVRDTT